MLFDNSHLQCPRLWNDLADDGESGVACFACMTRLPNVISLDTLDALAGCDHLQIFMTKSIRLPIEKFWAQHVYPTFAQKVVFHMLYFVLFTYFAVYAQTDDQTLENQAWELVVSAILVVGALNNWYLELKQFRRWGLKYFVDPANWFDQLNAVGVICTIFVKVVMLMQPSLQINWLFSPAAAMTIFVLGIKILFHLRGFEETSFLVTMLLRVTRDLRGFILIFSAMWVTFASIFSVLGGPGIFSSALSAPEFTFRMMLGDFEIKDPGNQCDQNDENAELSSEDVGVDVDGDDGDGNFDGYNASAARKYMWDVFLLALVLGSYIILLNLMCVVLFKLSTL